LTSAKKPNAAIVGIGETRLGRIPDQSAMQLMADAARQAADDAGIGFADIDGVITGPIRVEAWTNPAASIAVSLGISPRYLLTLNLAGATGAAMIQHAAMAVATGQANAVLCLAGQNLLSALSRGGAVQGMAEGGAAHVQFEAPYGPLVPTLYAIVAQRHMHEYGTTEEQMADVAVAIRHYASLNENAYMRDPLTRKDVMSARMITSPLKKFDCSVVCDGAGAAIVTTPDRARDMAGKAVPLLGSGYGLRHSFIGEAMDITASGACESGRDAFRQAGLGPEDIDVAELYDCFTITVIVELEDLGFCPKGEGGRFVEDGHIGPGGRLPVTTHGGLLSAGHFGPGSGFLHVLEGVRQMRGTAGGRQVPNAETALVHGNGGVIATHTTLILGSEATT
jgi:acetyl-CoA acetyltransferase